MKIGKTLRLALAAAVACILFGIGSYRESANAADDHGLFVSSAVARTSADSLTVADSTILRSRFATINWNMASAADAGLQRQAPGFGVRLALNLFDDANLAAVLDRREMRSEKSLTWFGYIEGVAESEVTLVVENGIMAGNIRAAGRYFQVRYGGADLHVVQEIDSSRFPPDGEPVPVRIAARSSARDAAIAAADDGAIFDVMVVYTPTARAAAGGTAAMDALVNLAVAETNTAYSRSGVIPRVRLVYSGEVLGYAESGDFFTDLSRLANRGDGLMDEVHTLRDAVGADVVSLIIEGDGSLCGIGYLMETLSPDFEFWAFSVAARNCATGNFTFGHEIAHNMGLQHDRINQPADGVFAHSHGYVDVAHGFRDIMGVATGCGGCPRIQNFSNPNVTFNGFPTGVPQGAANSADAAASLNATAFTVANWRPQVNSTPAVITVAPNSQNFGSVNVGSSASRDFTVQNSGAGTLTGNASTNPPYSIQSGGSYNLTAGQSQIVTVGFTPTAAGSFLGNVSFTGAGGATASVSGVGVGATLIVNPTTAAPGATVTATWSGIPSPSPADWIGVYAVGQPNTNYLAWIYVSCTKTAGSASAAGSCPFALPSSLTVGNYELRVLANNGYVSLASTTLTIQNLPVVTIVATDSIASEFPAGDNGVFTVSRTGSTASPLTVNYSVGGSATNGTDYSMLVGSVTIQSGQPSATIVVTAIDDAIGEGTESVTVTLSAAATYMVGSPASATVSIISDPPPGPVLSVSPSTAAAGSTVNATWSGILNPSPSDWIGLYAQGAPSTSYLEWVYVSCTKGVGIALAAGSCNFGIPAGLANGIYELRLLGNNGYTALATSNLITVGGPSLPVVSITATTSAAEPASNGQFTVNRSGSTTNALTVNYTVTGSATPGSDYANIGTSVVIQAGSATATIPVNVSDDNVFESSETVIVTLSNHASYTVGSPNIATVTIADDDPPPTGPTLIVSPTTINRGGSITANWSGIVNPTAKDWVGLYAVGAPNSPFWAWEYVSCTMTATFAQASGSCAFPIPVTPPPGTYELRLFGNDSFNWLATSNPLTLQ